MCAGGVVNVDIRFEHAAGDLDLYLVDAGEVLDQSDSSTDNEALSYENGAKRHRFVAIEAPWRCEYVFAASWSRMPWGVTTIRVLSPSQTCHPSNLCHKTVSEAAHNQPHSA